jgi:hypothetical protein
VSRSYTSPSSAFVACGGTALDFLGILREGVFGSFNEVVNNSHAYCALKLP